MEERATNTASLRAAQYVRMSTEHQQYSTENQAAVIAKYAAAHGMEIVRSYVDAGKSGLNLAGRAGLQELIRTVEAKQADFDSILVYDISRWGRFQDADESAFYEYLCKRAGIKVQYCAEPFENDNSTPSNLLKALKRTMAGEYSRELSTKVFAGQCRLIEMGFRQGGPAGYGLRRQLVDRDGQPKAILSRGECKSIQTDRVILIHGPCEEVNTARAIYQLFTKAAKTEQQIADDLNHRGLLTDLGRAWTRGVIHQILTNPKYIGANVYNRQSFKLKRKRIRNPKEMWLWRDNAFEPVIATEQFLHAQSIIQGRHAHYTDEELLERLRGLLAHTGVISGLLIDEADDMPSSSVYRNRSHSLLRAYNLIGYTPARDYSYMAINRQIREFYRQHFLEIVGELQKAGARLDQDPSTDLLTVNNEFTVSIILAKCRQSRTGNYRWLLRFDRLLFPDIILAARLGPSNQSVLDYYLLPSLDILESQIRLQPDNAINLDVYRFENLRAFIGASRRTALAEVA
jgi:DNA invertase Pin-like site-specific DNA recombinase